jgi:hypothetical protein
MSGKETQGLYNCTYTEAILDRLYTDGIFRFEKGDYITVKVNFDTKGSIYAFDLFGRKEDKTVITSGGEIG